MEFKHTPAYEAFLQFKVDVGGNEPTMISSLSSLSLHVPFRRHLRHLVYLEE